MEIGQVHGRDALATSVHYQKVYGTDVADLNRSPILKVCCVWPDKMYNGKLKDR
jgi:hypothetical protein